MVKFSYTTILLLRSIPSLNHNARLIKLHFLSYSPCFAMRVYTQLYRMHPVIQQSCIYTRHPSPICMSVSQNCCSLTDMYLLCDINLPEQSFQFLSSYTSQPRLRSSYKTGIYITPRSG